MNCNNEIKEHINNTDTHMTYTFIHKTLVHK